MNGVFTTLKHLANTVKKIGNIKSSPRLYEKIFSISKKIFDADTCSILLKDSASGTIAVAAASDPDVVIQRRVPGHGALGRALKTGVVQLAHEAIEDTENRGEILSEVVVPLRDNEEIIGVLKLESRKARFNDDYLDLFTIFGEQVAASISHLRVRKQVEERARILAAISKTSSLATSWGGQTDALDTVLHLVMETLGPDGCSLQLLDPVGNDLIVKQGLGTFTNLIGTHIPADRTIPGLAASTKRPSLIPDVSQIDEKISVLPEYLSEIAVPILFQEEVLGVLHMVHHCANVFDETHLLSAAIFADQLAIIIRGAQVAEARNLLESHLALLTKTSQKISGKKDLTALLNDLLALARKTLDVQHTSVLVPEPSEPYLRIFFAHGTPEDSTDIRIPVEGSITGGVYRTGAPAFVPDVSRDYRYLPGMDDALSEIAVPLKSDGEVIGVLNIESAAPLTAAHVNVLSLFATQIALVIDKADLKSRIEGWRHQFAMLNQAATLNTDMPEEALIDRILEVTIEALDLERCVLFLLDENGDDLYLRAHRGYGDLQGLRIAKGEGITGTVAASGTRLLIEDTGADDRYVDGGVNGRCEMAVPLVVHGEVIGVLDTEGTRVGMWGDDDLELFSAFAVQAAAAVHNKQIFGNLEDANRKLEENITEMVRMNTELTNYSKKVFRINESLEFQLKNLTAVHEAGKTITSSLDLDHTLNTILDMTSQIIGSTAGAIKLMDEETKEFRTRAKSGSLTDISSMSSVFEVPLKIGEKKIGIFELVLKTENGVGKGERRMVETLAAQAAIAIENARLFENTQQIYYDTLRSLARALEARDDYTRGHSERVADLAKRIAEKMALDDQEIQTIYNAALLHDIGKIGIRDKVLLAPRKLTQEEMNIIKDHSAFGNTILMPLKFLSNIREVVCHHHERWDGEGYPDGRKGDEIPLASRIIAVADAYDAMTSNRPYRTSISPRVAVKNIRELAGSQFDPRVVEAFVSLIEL